MKKILIFCLGTLIIQFGVSIFIECDLGVDTLTVFIIGIKNLLNISTGQSSILIMTSIFLIIFIFARDHIKLGTFLAMFICGIFLDIINPIISLLQIGSYPFVVRFILSFLASALIAYGLKVVLKAKMGVSPYDEFSYVLAEKTKFEFKYVRIALDITIIIIGFSLGGPVGIGTIIGALSIGPFIQFFTTSKFFIRE